MKRILISIASLLSIIPIFAVRLTNKIGKDVEYKERLRTLVLYKQMPTNNTSTHNAHVSHSAHMSHASHYSAYSQATDSHTSNNSTAVNYKHYVDKVNVEFISLSKKQISEIRKIIEKGFMKDGMKGYRYKCGEVNVESCYIKNIDENKINKPCYRVCFLLELYTENNDYARGYYEYYVTKDKSTYYEYKTLRNNSTPSNKVSSTTWLSKIINVIE